MWQPTCWEISTRLRVCHNPDCRHNNRIWLVNRKRGTFRIKRCCAYPSHVIHLHRVGTTGDLQMECNLVSAEKLAQRG
jgi:hypothetical protein